MPRVSKRPVSEKIQGELEDNFAYLVSSLSSSKDIEQFLMEFLTEEEKTMLTKRLMIHMMLYNHYEAKDIARVLSMSTETIRIHKMKWILGGGVYKGMIAKIAKREKAKEFWKKVETVLSPLELFLQSKSNMKARAKLLSGDYSKEK
jgi:uncharacterized protein YerC